MIIYLVHMYNTIYAHAAGGQQQQQQQPTDGTTSGGAPQQQNSADGGGGGGKGGSEAAASAALLEQERGAARDEAAASVEEHLQVYTAVCTYILLYYCTYCTYEQRLDVTYYGILYNTLMCVHIVQNILYDTWYYLVHTAVDGYHFRRRPIT